MGLIACSWFFTPVHATDGVSPKVKQEVYESIRGENLNSKYYCMNVILASSDPQNWWSKRQNLDYFAEYMKKKAPQYMAYCLQQLSDLDDYDSSKHQRAADILYDALYVTSSDEASAELIKQAKQDVPDEMWMITLVNRYDAHTPDVETAIEMLDAKGGYDSLISAMKIELSKRKGMVEAKSELAVLRGNVSQAVHNDVVKNLSVESGVSTNCLSIMILSADPNNWWSKKENLQYAAKYMAEHAPQTMSYCLIARHNEPNFQKTLHEPAAQIFHKALYPESQ